ncbi:MAG: class I SAM-dependent methyltransferase [Acidilobaceae archaeon]|jgi:SAM-dependent methyltransferase
MISDEEIRKFYELQGMYGDHVKQMYASGDLFTRYWQNMRRIIVERLIEELEVDSLLDVGCAEGLYTVFLACKRVYSVGIDISLPKLIRAKKRYGRWNVLFIQADAENLPFSDNLFDLVLLIDVLRLLRNPERALKEAFRVSRKYVIVQSGTPLRTLRNFGRVMPRDYSSIKRDFRTDPFGGAFWLFSSLGLIRLIRASTPNVRILRVIGIPSILTALPFNIVGYLRKSVTAVKIAMIIDHLVMERRVLNLMGSFTTILAEKEG